MDFYTESKTKFLFLQYKYVRKQQQNVVVRAGN